MTIEVQITNKSKDRAIAVREEHYRKRDMAQRVVDAVRIEPGQTVTLHLHLLKDLLLQEVEP